MAVPNTFASATTSIPLANLDANFAYYDAAYSISGTTVTYNGTVNITGLTASAVLFTDASKNLTSTGTVAVANGGTGLTATPANGALDIGNGTGFTRTTLTAGAGISVTNAAGAITIAATGGSTPTSIANGTSNVSIASANGAVTVATNGATAVTVDTSQNVGIGTASPSYKLVIKQSSGDTQFAIQGAVKNWNFRNQADGTFGLFDDSVSAWRYMYDTSNNHIWFNGSSAERMRIDSSGNVGIGTSSPTARLHSYATSGTTTTLGRFEAAIGSYTGTSLIAANTLGASSAYNLFSCITDSDGDAGGPVTQFLVRGDGNVGIGTASPNFQVSFGANIGKTFALFENAGTSVYGIGMGGAGSGGDPYRLKLFSNGTNNVSLTDAGNFLINATSTGSFSAGARLSALGVAGEFTAVFRAPETGNYIVLSCDNPNGQVGKIQTSGSATSFLTSSDYRLKEDIIPMTGALAKVALLKPVTYKWKVDGTAGQGFIAHELQEVVPDCVGGEKDAVDANGNPQYQGVDTSFLVATLTAAIQEQQALIVSLTARIAALESN